MLKDLHTLSPYLDFIHACSADPDYRDPMLLTEQQLHRNLLDAPENPNTRVLGTFENDTVTGVFALLVPEDEKYLEFLAGLSRSAAAYDELLAHLKSAYPGYQADFVYNPRNRLLQAALEALDAKFDPEQQKLVLRRTVPYVPDARIVPYRPEYRAQYLALHTGDRYWTGEKVLAAPEIFRVLLAIEDGEAAGYIDLTHNSAENEPYDLFVRKESRRRGLGRALLSAAVQENRPNGMALLVDIDNEAAIALYESQGFDRAEGETTSPRIFACNASAPRRPIRAAGGLVFLGVNPTGSSGRPDHPVHPDSRGNPGRWVPAPPELPAQRTAYTCSLCCGPDTYPCAASRS